MRRASSVLAVLLVSTAVLAAEPNVRTRTIDRSFDGVRRMVLQAARPLTPADEAELAAQGVVIGRALPNGRYLARVAGGKAIADARVAAIEPLSNQKKITRTALREASIGRTWAELNVYFHDDVDFERARTALLSAGAAIEPLLLDFGSMKRITAKVAPEAMEALAANDDVAAITGPVRFKIRGDNAPTAVLQHVTELYGAPYGLSGAGVTVSLFELGPAQADHVEFGGRLIVQPSVTGGNSANRLHATHVAGTIGASGVRVDAKGMAPAVKIFQFCVRSGGNTCTGNFLDDKDTELTKIGSAIDNNSWGYILGWDSEDYPVWNDGDILWGAYWLEMTSPIDAISLERDVLFVHSAGNDGDAPFLGDFANHRHVDDNGDTIKDKLFCYSIRGDGTDCPAAVCTGGCETTKHHTMTPYDTIGVTASGKNTIAVGAVQLLGESLTIAGFSSRGPAKDGRVKPDVVARGFGVLSTIPTGGYGVNQGTSMAAPSVTGIAALLTEQHRKTLGTDPGAVELKALILAGAQDIGPAGPDYTFGYGLVNAKASADLIIANSGRGIRKFNVSQTSPVEIPLIISEPQANMRVLLQWGDPSIPLTGDEFIADKALVNDLDIKVVGPNGTEYLPYVLDPANVEKLAAPGVNTRDNTELVEIKSAAAGVYRAIISGAKASKAQDAVLVTSARTPAPCVDPTESTNNDAQGYGDLSPGSTIYAGLCTSTDVDRFRFNAMPGAVSVVVTTGDTAVTVELSGGATSSLVVPANTTQTVSGTVTGSTAKSVTVSIRPQTTVGLEPLYSFTPRFTQQSGTRRRSVR